MNKIKFKNRLSVSRYKRLNLQLIPSSIGQHTSDRFILSTSGGALKHWVSLPLLLNSSRNKEKVGTISESGSNVVSPFFHRRLATISQGFRLSDSWKRSRQNYCRIPAPYFLALQASLCLLGHGKNRRGQNDIYITHYEMSFRFGKPAETFCKFPFINSVTFELLLLWIQ